MEKKEKTWKRRGLFALVSNRRLEMPHAEDESLFSVGEDAFPAPENGEAPR